ncbi:DUF4253 domain-containing protein [Stackebrandtia nassauensis]|uniref:DUF4253 domain-containing protein n=1 Tax=Stackebrandtia nassauensis TaxID=283811 RepID=UPI00118662A6|nr:DUF4253 domain-containing protein [Stackebrandtia nassauensis]
MGLLQRLLGRKPEDEADNTTPPAPAESPAETPPAESAPPPTSSVLGDAAPLPETETVAEPGPEPEPEPTAAVEPEAGEPSASATEAEPDEVDKTVVPPQEYFTPSRPKRELLDLEPPPQPKDEPPQTPETLPLDVSGSPRAALRNAGITVPHMQQIVQLGDVRLWAFGVRADEALGWWLQIRQVHEKTGWLPVLLGSPDDWLDNGEGVLHEGDAELERMTELDAETLLHDKAAEAGEPPRGVPILPTRGDSDFAVPKSDGLIGLVEAEHSWQIPALLPWKGSTNWELYGAEHATILKHWHERHEVELVSMTWDILELYVPNPPSAEEDALDTAREVHAYCPDLMAAGVPTLDDLAVHMVRSRAWYFRWA